MEFESFPKIARLNRDIVITEKLDGTNGQVYIFPITGPGMIRDFEAKNWVVIEKGGFNWAVLAGSRNRFVCEGKKDNYGFGGFVRRNAEELLEKLGPGHHYGEWFGQGIQRGYGLEEKRFALFNVHRWNNDDRPLCCEVVPTLYVGKYDQAPINSCLEKLRSKGSIAAPGFENPEGIVVFHSSQGHLYKVTLEGDESPKSLVEAA